MTPQAKAFWEKRFWGIAGCAVLLPITIYQVIKKPNDWLFIAAIGLCWLLVVYRYVREFRSAAGTADQGSGPRGN